DVETGVEGVGEVGAELARGEARGADDAIALGDDVGPLDGVPFTVKDWIEGEGLVCAAGFAERADIVPKRDATVVARMRAAGAIVLGKTNVGGRATVGHEDDGARLYERPRNPYDVQ